MAQNGHVVNGQDYANAPALPTASLFRFYRWNDRGHDTQHDHVEDRIQRRRLDIQKLDNAPFQKLVVLVAASGFFIDGYLLFANNFALPILGSLYWPSELSSSRETGINCATLAGTILGQITFGIWADCKGRKRVYGYELLTVLVGSVFISFASTGRVLAGNPSEEGSINIIALLVIFRFIIGFGVGAEYPITSAITSEWAPADYRGQMLAFVFSAQSLGQCIAAIVAYGPLAGGRMSPDAVWRLIYGVPAIPAFVVFFIRRTIPETPRFVWDVQRDAAQASDGIRYMTATSKAPDDAENPQLHGPDPDDPLNELPPVPSWTDFKEYFLWPEGKWYNNDGDEIWSLGSWTTFRFTGKWPRLLGTAGTWFLLDLSFFGLGLNSPQIVTGLWKGCRNDSVANPSSTYTWNSEPEIANKPVQLFEDNELSFWSIVSTGAIAGSGLLILIARFADRRKLLWMSFLALGLFFFVIGGILWHKIMNHFSPSYIAVVIFYVICQFLFNLGPNALTFIIPAEIFPTRYRCTCLGISAAFGKLGSVVAQVSLLHIQLNPLHNCQHTADTNLGHVLIGFGFVMLLGAVVAWFLPRVQYGRNNKNETLEKLGKGPPPQPTPAADAEQGPQETQQLGDSLAPHHVLSGETQPQHHQHHQHQQSAASQSWLINEHHQEPHYERPLPPLPTDNNHTPSNRPPQPRSRRKPVQAPPRQQYSEEFEMEDSRPSGSSRPQRDLAADNQPESWYRST